MYCTKCGNELTGGEKFCSKCGRPINNGNIQNKGNEEKTSSQAMIGFILGLCSIVAWFLPIIGYPVTITGIVFSSKGMKSSNRGKAIAGLTLSIIFLIFTIINSLIGAIIGAGIMSDLYYY